MKKTLSLSLVVTIVTLAFSGCSKKGTTTQPTSNTTTSSYPKVETSTLNDARYTTASCVATITSNGGSTITSISMRYCTDRGVLSGTGSGTASVQRIDSSTSVSTCTFTLVNLARNTKYYVQASAVNANGAAYGTLDSFTTMRGVVVKDTFAGGIVFYVDSTYEHGLAFATSEQSTSIEWDNGTHMNVSGATGTALGTGKANTDAIIAAQGSGTYAALACKNYAGGGFHDWYLPSIVELRELYDVMTVLFLNKPYYWSSSQYNSGNAWCEYHNDLVGDYVDFYTKDIPMHVRAIRSF